MFHGLVFHGRNPAKNEVSYVFLYDISKFLVRSMKGKYVTITFVINIEIFHVSNLNPFSLLSSGAPTLLLDRYSDYFHNFINLQAKLNIFT